MVVIAIVQPGLYNLHIKIFTKVPSMKALMGVGFKNRRDASYGPEGTRLPRSREVVQSDFVHYGV
jgi:hypothetical protein